MVGNEGFGPELSTVEGGMFIGVEQGERRSAIFVCGVVALQIRNHGRDSPSASALSETGVLPDKKVWGLKPEA